jgi:restriction endonuclease S subunit
MNGQAIERPTIATSISGATPQEGWRWSKLGDLARLESGHTPSRSRLDWWGGDVSWLSLTEIRAFDGQWVDETQLRTNEAGIANSAARILPRGTVCLSRTASVGFVAIIGRPMATSQDFANWVCGDDLDPEFLMYALIKSRRFLREIATGATHKTIYMPALKTFHICHPTRDQQKKIVVRLKAQLAEVKKARQAAKAALQDVNLLAIRLKEGNAKTLINCPKVPLGELLLGIEAGRSFQTSERRPRHDELGVLKVSAVSWNEFKPDEAKAIDGVYEPGTQHRVKKGDLIISRANTLELVGAVVRSNEDYPHRLLSDKTLRLVIDENRVHPDYMLNVLKLPEARSYIEKNATGTSNSMRNISQKNIKAVPIPLPTLKQQSDLVRRQKTTNQYLDDARKNVKQQLNELSMLPKKILAQSFEM